MENLKVGDVVQLKSGGPKMTICQKPWNENKNLAQCQWFKNEESVRDVFHLDTLQLAK